MDSSESGQNKLEPETGVGESESEYERMCRLRAARSAAKKNRKPNGGTGDSSLPLCGRKRTEMLMDRIQCFEYLYAAALDGEKFVGHKYGVLRNYLLIMIPAPPEIKQELIDTIRRRLEVEGKWPVHEKDFGVFDHGEMVTVALAPVCWCCFQWYFEKE